MIQEISKEDLFRKIDTLKVKCFDTEDALKSAEIRIQKLNKCNDYANEEIERLNNIINEALEYIESYINQFNGVYPTADMRYLDLHKLLGILKGSDKE